LASKPYIRYSAPVPTALQVPAAPDRPDSTGAIVPAFVRGLRDYGDRVALLAPDGTSLTYAELNARATETAVAFGGGGARRLVLLEGSNTVGSIAHYLGALAAGHVVLLTPGEHGATTRALIEAYDPDVVVWAPEDRDAEPAIDERRPGSGHDLHPDLTLLLTTSGSTGSPKLVRLSTENLDANAAAIVASLDIGPGDRVPTTLPMHYAYGLSVIHSHFLAGAALIVTDLSVVDACFWDRFRSEGGTTLNGVPYTFDCLDRIGFADLDLPHLRSVTQAGGRLDPDRVRAYAELGRRHGWSFRVMYGQTEAGPRMAVLPADLAAAHPSSIGRAIPGGELRIEPVPGAPDDIGELVYRGPNVMLGYAESRADLALGRTVTALRTGDLGRRTADGLFEVTGRRNAFVKLAGIRVDLEHLERRLQAEGLRAWPAGDDATLVVAVEGEEDAARIPALVSEMAAVPARLVRPVAVDEIPRLPSGKPDRAAIRALGQHRSVVPGDGPADTSRLTRDGHPPTTPAPATALPPMEAIRELYAESMGRVPGDRDSFVGLGGDSLSYVHVSLGLEEILGRLPSAWPSMTVGELAATATPRRPRPRWRERLAPRWVETSVVLRAVAILCIVGQHIGLFDILGGAHVLIAVAGYNFARFQLTSASRLVRLRTQARAIGRLAVPAMVWIALMLVLVDDYQLQNLFLANAIVGAERWDSTWHFWFIEMLLYVLVAMAALLAIPAVDRFERRWPFALACGILLVGIAFRFHVVDLDLTNPRPILWLFALGWAAGKATTWWQRVALAVVVVAAASGFYSDPQREAVIAAGVLAIIAMRRIPLPRLAVPVVGVLASASLYIYLVHWQVWQALPDVSRPVVFALCIGAGLLAWVVARSAGAALTAIHPRQLYRRGASIAASVTSRSETASASSAK